MVWLGPRRSLVVLWRIYHTRPSIKILQENLQEEKQRSTRGLQEEVESSFGCFEGVRVGGKGG